MERPLSGSRRPRTVDIVSWCRQAGTRAFMSERVARRTDADPRFAENTADLQRAENGSSTQHVAASVKSVRMRGTQGCQDQRNDSGTPVGSTEQDLRHVASCEDVRQAKRVI